ncbi:MAG: hypothetical protein GC150_09685 [Rhizobiales bacterium]|nr:hypothetical protein [Hyphomicrobiales bacterium]
MNARLDHVLASALQDAGTGWSMGSFGALAEFHQDVGENLLVDRSDALARATARGGIRLDEQAVAQCRAIAYEQLSKNRERWGQGLALCLPEADAVMAGRKVVTPLGPDEDAIRDEDRGAPAFDMGLGLKQCDFLVRTRDAALIEVLEENAGRSVFETGNPTMGAILKAHPHRIAVTPLGRVEVYQMIGGPETGGASPPGPHTHVLPKLMAAGKTHAGNITVPFGLVPCGYMHPGNPLLDGLGNPQPYDAELALRFSNLVEAFAPEELRTIKHEVVAAVAAAQAPASYEEPASRAGRITLRVTLRQLAQAAAAGGDSLGLATINAWREHFDSPGAPIDEESDEQVDHKRGSHAS